ncbi:MAG: hypothetical protein ABJB49_02745 [Nitrospirota bacterium]
MIPANQLHFGATLILMLSLCMPVAAQLRDHDHSMTQHSAGVPRWEGSVDGIAYSEFNHHLAAVFVLFMGLSELLATFALRSLAWTRFLLPAAMLAAGGYLLGWSDHDAWPIGSLSFAQTFVADDPEIQQHKLYAVLFLGVGTSEGLRWLGKIPGRAGAWPLSVLAIVGGVLLFAHEHGENPAAHSIAMNHMIMGTTAIAAGFFRLAVLASVRHDGPTGHWAWQLAWPGLIMLIGVQLFLYTE